jgi:hypothetical protein
MMGQAWIGRRRKGPTQPSRATKSMDETRGGLETIIRVSVEKIVMDLALPESLASVRPYVRSERPSTVPATRLKKNAAISKIVPQPESELDTEKGEKEERYLSRIDTYLPSIMSLSVIGYWYTSNDSGHPV